MKYPKSYILLNMQLILLVSDVVIFYFLKKCYLNQRFFLV
jgi:hypothetical protein